MHNSILEVQRRTYGVIIAGNNVRFDTILMNLLDVINYDSTSGRIIIKNIGKYYIDWFVKINTDTVGRVSFSISTVDGKLLPGNITEKADEISGRTFINITKVPMEISLVNTTKIYIKYALYTSIKARLTIQQVDIEDFSNEELNNLVDGNAPGSVRGINTSTAYTMGNNAMAIGNNTVATGTNSFAMGLKTKAVGNISYADGENTIASESQAHGEGYNTTASGEDSHAEGQNTVASGEQSHAEGYGSEASGFQSHAQGYYATASGVQSHAEGKNTIASSDHCHAEGQNTVASGEQSHAEGYGSEAIGAQSHAQGNYATASGVQSHAEGQFTIASGEQSHGEGKRSEVIGFQAHGEGYYTTAGGEGSHAEGLFTVATGIAAHAEGQGTKARGIQSHGEGEYTVAEGQFSHGEGYDTTASWDSSHVEGDGSEAGGEGSHAEGGENFSHGEFSHTEGYKTTADGDNSHAEGGEILASGHNAHAEGYQTKAIGDNSHVQGVLTKASGNGSHAEGGDTVASGNYSHSEGLTTDTKNYEGAHIMGQYGEATEKYSWFIANGIPTGSSIGTKWLASTKSFYASGYVTTGADYAEYFESMDGNDIDVGYFVTFAEGEKIRIANECDNYILGIVSALQGVTGNSSEFNWNNKYLTDEWGRVLYEDVIVQAITNKDVSEIDEECKERLPRINPGYNDKNEYIPRRQREEWIPVGLLGRLRVRDNGNCMVNGYCKVGDGGIAIPNDRGYRVLERTGKKQIMILFTISEDHREIEKMKEKLQYCLDFINKTKEY